MSGVAGIILACRQAVASAVTTAGIKCFTYSNVDLPARPPVATLTLDGVTLRRFDQGVGIGTVKLLMESYQLLEGDATIAQQATDDDVATVMTALGADLTLGGKVVGCDLVDDPVQHFEVRPGGKYVVMTWTIEVEPFANAA